MSGEMHLKLSGLLLNTTWAPLLHTWEKLHIPFASHVSKICDFMLSELGQTLDTHQQALKWFYISMYIALHNQFWRKAPDQNTERRVAMTCHTVHALIHNWLLLVSVMMLSTCLRSNAESWSVSPENVKIKHTDQKHFTQGFLGSNLPIFTNGCRKLPK